MGDTGFEDLQKSPMKNTSSLSLGAESGAFFARIDFGTFHTLRAGAPPSRKFRPSSQNPSPQLMALRPLQNALISRHLRAGDTVPRRARRVNRRGRSQTSEVRNRRKGKIRKEEMENQRWEMEFTESWRHGTRS